MTDCTFCRIVSGELPCSLVFQDPLCLAFMDIQPVNPGHVLVVPRSHAPRISALEPATLGHLAVVARAVAGALYASALRCEGVNLVVSDGEAAEQTVFHVHLHVLPRYTGDGCGFRRRPESEKVAPRNDLDADAARLRAALKPAIS